MTSSRAERRLPQRLAAVLAEDLAGGVDVTSYATAPADASIATSTRALLTAERTLLNVLCQLSGVATLTRAWVDAVAGTGCAVRDTRKTTPLMRALEKYAVRCGGGVNHRMALSDEALIRTVYPDLAVQVEVGTYEQALEASGGLTRERAALVAATGVDYVAVGALTHSPPALDLGFDLRSAEVGDDRC